MQKLLIVGSGDIARRMLPQLRGRYQIYTLVRNPEERVTWRERGAIPVLADLDRPDTLARISGLADLVVHLAPPPAGDAAGGNRDTRTRSLLAALARGRSLPQRIVYVSTSGVYGDCAGACVDETHALRPRTARAWRRLDAERQLRGFGCKGVVVCILRAPGIYSAGRLPLDRLRQQIPALRDEDDVYTNHIHAEDLALMACAALRYGRSNRAYNASDDSHLKMGEYFDLVADRFGLSRVPRVTPQEARSLLSPMQWSFMNESRRLLNRRAKTELKVRLRFPRVEDGVAAASQEGQAGC